MPKEPALAVLGLTLRDASGAVLQRNFTTFRVKAGTQPRDQKARLAGRPVRILRFSPASFSSAKWSRKQWSIMDGLKVNGAGHGYYEYRLPWPAGLQAADIAAAEFRAELAAKQLFGKDQDKTQQQEGDFMLGKGTFDPSLNPNAYPMTDTTVYPSAVRIRLAGTSLGVFELPDDPADHRGVLSWHAQKPDRKLHEAGSYGFLIEAQIPASGLAQAAAAGEIVLRLEVDEALPGGLAIYGEDFGRYPMDPSLVFALKK
jgi:hypothetical protein